MKRLFALGAIALAGMLCVAFPVAAASPSDVLHYDAAAHAGILDDHAPTPDIFAPSSALEFFYVSDSLDVAVLSPGDEDEAAMLPPLAVRHGFDMNDDTLRHYDPGWQLT